MLLQKEGIHTPGNSVGEGIANLYDEMNTLVGDELHVNIEQEGGRLFFRLWKYHKWGSFTLYYFPVKFLESLNPVLRRIAITFIHKLMKANGIDTFLDYEESDFVFEMLSEDDGSAPEEWKERMKLLDSYQEGKSAGCSNGWNRNPTTRTCRKHWIHTNPKTGLRSLWSMR